MLVRTRGGEEVIRGGAGLLACLRGELGMGPEEGGVKGVKDGLDIELIAGLPFRLSGGKGKTAIL
jgi:hypothetical protein